MHNASQRDAGIFVATTRKVNADRARFHLDKQAFLWKNGGLTEIDGGLWMKALKWAAACAVMFGFFMGWATGFDAVGLIMVIAAACSALMFNSGIGEGDAVGMKIGTLAILGSLFVGAIVGALVTPVFEPGTPQFRIQAQQPHSRPR